MAITATAGLILLILLDEYRAALGDWLTKDPGQAASRLRMTFGSLAVLIAGPILGFSAYFWRLGGRIVTTERFPPPGMAVVRDTHVLQNGAARRRGRLIQAGAALLASAGCAIALMLWMIQNLLWRNR